MIYLLLYSQLEQDDWVERDRQGHEEFTKQKEKEEHKLKEREEREVGTRG